MLDVGNHNHSTLQYNITQGFALYLMTLTDTICEEKVN